jgi:hypothetical protein
MLLNQVDQSDGRTTGRADDPSRRRIATNPTTMHAVEQAE